MAEHVLAMMLALARGVDRMLRAQSKRCWDRGPVRCELLGSTALVVGLGDIGTEVAARCKALGMRVLGVRRRVERGGTTAVDTVVGFDGVDAVLPEVDHVVLALPGTPHTARFLDARRIGLLKRGAYVYNVGRGSAIDEAALVDALKEGAIAGAGLDVFEREPLPAESDLWSLDNVVISPHCAGSTEDYGERFAAILVENIQRYLKGEPLRNEVDRFFGY
jgi:phosphoglycerate dehydrogenase-like enzyme